MALMSIICLHLAYLYLKVATFLTLPIHLHSILVNEAMVKHFNWEEPIGKRVKFPGDTSGNYLEVVGVVKDFNQKSLYNPIEPLLLFYYPNSNIIQLKLNPGDINATITKVESTWKKYFPELPFEYKFLDADYNSQYAADQKRGKIFAAFSILTIIITCLGLLGLTAFTTQQRQKEISIRRVMGASVYAGDRDDYSKLFVAGIDSCCYCISNCLVFHEQLVADISIQHRFVFYSVYCIGFYYFNDGSSDGNVLFCQSSRNKTI